MGLKDNVCGQIGVMRMAGTLGCIMAAPAAAAYAVLPVGVDIIRPGKGGGLKSKRVNFTGQKSFKRSLTIPKKK